MAQGSTVRVVSSINKSRRSPWSAAVLSFCKIAVRVRHRNGYVALEAVVDSEADKNLAGFRMVFRNVFSVNNDLVV